jgi:hypothetical protein
MAVGSRSNGGLQEFKVQALERLSRKSCCTICSNETESLSLKDIFESLGRKPSPR